MRLLYSRRQEIKVSDFLLGPICEYLNLEIRPMHRRCMPNTNLRKTPGLQKNLKCKKTQMYWSWSGVGGWGEFGCHLPNTPAVVLLGLLEAISNWATPDYWSWGTSMSLLITWPPPRLNVIHGGTWNLPICFNPHTSRKTHAGPYFGGRHYSGFDYCWYSSMAWSLWLQTISV